MWIIFAFLSAFFAAITGVLAKCGIKNTDSTVATAIRTIVVLIMSFMMVAVVGSLDEIGAIGVRAWIFLILSGLSTGASWLCYFKALSMGDINKVVPIDKSSTVLTMLFAFAFFGEFAWIKLVCCAAIGVGTYLMIEIKETRAETKGSSWLVYAVLSAVFAALTSVLGKLGIEGVESNLGTMIRTAVVLLMAWMMVFVTHKTDQLKDMSKKELCYICLSGLATGASWLCYYKALKDGPASIVVPIDKLSIVIIVVFSYIVFKEKLTKRGFLGLALIVTGTMCMLI